MKTISLDRKEDIRQFWEIMGFNEGDFISIIGRTGSGKTAVSLILACLAYEVNRKKVLFIGSEDYQDKFNEYCSRYQKKNIKKTRSDDDWVTIRVTNNDISFEEIKEYVREYDPDLVVIDSYVAYKGFDDVMDFATQLKSLAMVDKKVVLVTTQLSRIDDEKDIQGNCLSFVSSIILFCSLQDKAIHAEVIKCRDKDTAKIFESDYL